MDASTWKNTLQSMEGPRWPIRCGHEFSPADLAALREGFWPHDMDDRWAIWLDGDMLRCWRSWSRTCVYEASIVLADDGTGVCPVLDVLDLPEEYSRSSSEEGELARFEGVLSLLRQPRDDASEALAWSFATV